MPTLPRKYASGVTGNEDLVRLRHFMSPSLSAAVICYKRTGKVTFPAEGLYEAPLAIHYEQEGVVVPLRSLTV